MIGLFTRVGTGVRTVLVLKEIKDLAEWPEVGPPLWLGRCGGSVGTAGMTHSDFLVENLTVRALFFLRSPPWLPPPIEF